MATMKGAAAPLGRVQILALVAAVGRGDAEVTMLGTGERRKVADVVDEHRGEIVAMARGSASVARLVEGFDAGRQSE